jgi:hypothetical protein
MEISARKVVEIEAILVPSQKNPAGIPYGVFFFLRGGFLMVFHQEKKAVRGKGPDKMVVLQMLLLCEWWSYREMPQVDS